MVSWLVSDKTLINWLVFVTMRSNKDRVCPCGESVRFSILNLIFKVNFRMEVVHVSVLVCKFRQRNFFMVGGTTLM